MTKILLSLFVKNPKNTDDPKTRSAIGSLSGIVGIVCNLLLFAGKLAVGTLAVSGVSGVMLNVLGAANDGIQFWFYAYELVLAIYVFSELLKYSYETKQVNK